MTSAVDWLMSKFGTNFARNSKFHIRMTILCQLRDSVTPALSITHMFVGLFLTGCNVGCFQWTIFFVFLRLLFFALLLLYETKCTLWRLPIAFLKC